MFSGFGRIVENKEILLALEKLASNILNVIIVTVLIIVQRDDYSLLKNS